MDRKSESLKQAITKYRKKLNHVSISFNMEKSDDVETLEKWTILANQHGSKKRAIKFLINNLSD